MQGFWSLTVSVPGRTGASRQRPSSASCELQSTGRGLVLTAEKLVPGGRSSSLMMMRIARRSVAAQTPGINGVNSTPGKLFKGSPGLPYQGKIKPSPTNLIHMERSGTSKIDAISLAFLVSCHWRVTISTGIRKEDEK